MNSLYSYAWTVTIDIYGGAENKTKKNKNTGWLLNLQN